jgi:hypothetical protein
MYRPECDFQKKITLFYKHLLNNISRVANKIKTELSGMKFHRSTANGLCPEAIKQNGNPLLSIRIPVSLSTAVAIESIRLFRI